MLDVADGRQALGDDRTREGRRGVVEPQVEVRDVQRVVVERSLFVRRHDVPGQDHRDPRLGVREVDGNIGDLGGVEGRLVVPPPPWRRSARLDRPTVELHAGENVVGESDVELPGPESLVERTHRRLVPLRELLLRRTGHQDGPKDLALPRERVARARRHVPQERCRRGDERRREAGETAGEVAGEKMETVSSSPEEEPSSAERKRLRRQWAQLIRRIYEADPLLCQCGQRMRILSFLTDPPVVDKILKHVESKAPGSQRGPPPDDDEQQQLAY